MIKPGKFVADRRPMAPVEACGQMPKWQKDLARYAGCESARSQVEAWRGSEACIVGRPQRNDAV
jgi:hypothetical protein